MPLVIRKKPVAPGQEYGDGETFRRIQPDEYITRTIAAATLGITRRTLDNWNRRNFGPKRFRISPGRYRYKRSECEAWVGNNGKGARRPRKRRGACDADA